MAERSDSPGIPALREITERDEALELCSRLDRHAAEIQSEFRDEALPAGVSQRFIEQHLGADETVLLVAEFEPGSADVGLCLVGPFEDPLTAERLPLILVLHVEPSLRHRGHAGRLVSEAGRILAGRGLGRFACRAGHNDDALISMGERWGFVRQWELMVRE